MTFRLTRNDRLVVLKIVAVYTLFGALWIYLSDSALGLLVRDPDIITRIATYKGLLFIFTTAALLYFLIGRYIARISDFNHQLQADEARFSAITDTTSDGFYATDRNGRFMDVNSVYCRASGYSRQELFSMRISDIEAVEGSADVAAHIARIITAGSDHFETRHRRKDGSLMDVEVSVTFLAEQDRFYSFLRDITERKNIEKQLRLTGFTMANISDAVYWIAADSRFLDVNEAACRMRGYTREEILSMCVADIDPNSPPEAWPAHWEELKRAGSMQFETVHRTKYGATVDVEVTANYFRYLDTEYNCAVVRDISERKAAERSLMESEDEFRSLMELMPVGVAWADNNGLIQYINKSFIEKFGYELAEIPSVAEWYAKAYPDPSYRNETVAGWEADIGECRAHGTPVVPRDAKVSCKDGTVRNVIVNTQVTQHRILAIFTDITERESLQEELIKKQKLESIGVLAGGIAHDFNNILTAILGNISFAEMLIEKGNKASSPLHEAGKAAKRAAELAQQLLTFSRGGQPVTRAVSVRQVIEDSISLVLRGANVTATVDAPESLPAIEADAGQISQVFNNLVINAVQAMPGGGSIAITAAEMSIDGNNPMSLPPGRYVRITCTDQGCGITPEILKKIFDPYFTTKPCGSGLGLASAHSIINKHGGRISVCSAPGQGTTFELLLPASPEKPSSANAAETGTLVVEGGEQSVLVMDDEDMIRDLASALLEELGCRVTACSSGEEAIDLYRAAYEAGTRFRAVIMDLTIPGGMGGKETARSILDIDPSARLIVSSGYSTDPVMADCREFGFCGAVFKPYAAGDLAAVLKEAFNTTERT
ncbi:MAG: PAS domain S-box protein [Geobacteraceae bacterium]|nr:PAS domain S-box protein [Geobacteraceae bacterium]